MGTGKIIALAIVGSVASIFVFGLFIGPQTPGEPETMASATVGCGGKAEALTLARSLASTATDKAGLTKWAEQNRCGLTPAGTVFLATTEEVGGNSHVTEVSINGSTRYLIGLPRPTSQEKLSAATARLSAATAKLTH